VLLYINTRGARNKKAKPGSGDKKSHLRNSK